MSRELDMRVMKNWSFSQRYNDEGEWNPRLILCDSCQEYKEPEEIEECQN